MCARHWRMVPLRMQRMVCVAYAIGQCDTKRPSYAWLAAAQIAISTVADKEGYGLEQRTQIGLIEQMQRGASCAEWEQRT